MNLVYAFILISRSLDEIIHLMMPHQQGGSKSFDDDGRLKRTGTVVIFKPMVIITELEYQIMDDRMHLSGKDGSVKHIAIMGDTETPNIIYRSGWGDVADLYDIVVENDRARDVLQRSGLQRFFQIRMKRNDQQLTYGILERWWFTTNSFHFPQFEIGFTPLDFVLLSGIPIGNGREPLKFNSTTGWSEDKYEEIENEFMIPLRELGGGLRGYSTKRPDMSTSCLAEYIKLKRGLINDNNWMHVTRYFLLWVIGKVFMASSTIRVSKGWLETLRDLDTIGQYDWGFAIFSRLYRDMSSVVRGGKNMGGMWMLLEYWFYIYLHTLTSLIKTSVSLVDEWPAVMVFRRANLINKQRDSKKRSLSEARNQIELRTSIGTDWHPWEYSRFAEEPDIVHACELSLKRVVFYDPQHESGVKYLGERFLRQLTDVIVIPVSPWDPMTITDLTYIPEPLLVVVDRDFRIDDETTYLKWWKDISFGYMLGQMRRQDNRDEVGAASTQDPGFMVDHVPPMHPTRYEYDHIQQASPDFPQFDWNVQHSDHLGNPINVPVERPYPRTEFDVELETRLQWKDLCEKLFDFQIASNTHHFQRDRERVLGQHIGEGSTSSQPYAFDRVEDSPVRLGRKRPAHDGAYFPTAAAPQSTDAQDYTQNSNLTELLSNTGISVEDMEKWGDFGRGDE